jgi:uncharacterized protein (DUF4415 family)
MAARPKDLYDAGRSLREEVAYARLVAELERMQAWWQRDRQKPGVVPSDPAWIRRPPGPRTKLTLKLDAEVVKFFRAMGLGYQARMDYALQAWMLEVVVREMVGEGGLG